MTRPLTAADLAELRVAAAQHPDGATAEFVRSVVDLAADLPESGPIQPSDEPMLFEDEVPD